MSNRRSQARVALVGAAFGVVALTVAGCATTSRGIPMSPGPAVTNAVCVLRTALPTGISFTAVGRVEASRGGFGRADDLLPLLAAEARKLGGDAVVNVDVSQGAGLFGTTQPSARGLAVKINSNEQVDCVASGGAFH